MLFALGIWACDVTGRKLGIPDTARWYGTRSSLSLLVLAIVPRELAWQAAGFILFACSDIASRRRSVFRAPLSRRLRRHVRRHRRRSLHAGRAGVIKRLFSDGTARAESASDLRRRARCWSRRNRARRLGCSSRHRVAGSSDWFERGSSPTQRRPSGSCSGTRRYARRTAR